MRFFVPILAAALLLGAGSSGASEEFRFPMPEFDTDYQHPAMHTPPPSRTEGLLDVAALAAAMLLAAWLVLKRRSRAGLFVLTVLSLAYFGFWRQGCVCSVGSIQNVIEALFLPGERVSVTVAAFFLLPLAFALFFGRVFCAAVCPLGAIQEIVAVRPVTVPAPIERALRLIPYFYLGITVLSVMAGSGFLICRYDPFVGFFRGGGNLNMLLIGGALLVLGVYVGRPYCRFLCPYGVLLGWMSRFSKWHASITPSECIQCRLCEDSCPYGAIQMPTPSDLPWSRRQGARRLALLLLLAPAIIGAGALAGLASHRLLARLHPTVRLARQVAAEESGALTMMTLESEAFRAGKKTIGELCEEARAIQGGFRRKSAVFGGFMGVVVAGALAGLSIVRKRTDYETDRETCVSCARCFAYCPVGKNDDLK